MKKIVGNKGVFVSGGEKQGIALARSLMKNPEALLLDEFGNSIHENMEIEIYKNLISFYKDKTIIAASHRVNIANLFDKNLFIKLNKNTMIINHHTRTFKISSY
jgi:ABC-type bacteriocin/lantibiotic exporter with double-glycine peptidase domain